MATKITIPKIFDMWSSKRRYEVSVNICNVPEVGWEISISSKRFNIKFTSLDYAEAIRKAYFAGKHKDYFEKEEELEENIESGEKIKTIRKSLGLTQAQFCKYLSKYTDISISQSYLSELEKGLYNQSNEILKIVSELYDRETTDKIGLGYGS